MVVDAVFPVNCLTTLCRAFHARFPAVALQVYSEALGGVDSLVLSGECTLGIAADEGRRAPELIEAHLTDIAMVPVAAPSHALALAAGPLDAEAMRAHVQIAMTVPDAKGGGPSGGILSTQVWRVADALTKRALIVAGLGWGRLPRPQVAEDLAAHRLVSLHVGAWGATPRRRPLMIVHRRDTPPDAVGTWIIARLRSSCGLCVDRGDGGFGCR